MRIEMEEEEEKGFEVRAIEALGRGFDLSSDFKLKFAKPTGRLVVLDDRNKRDILIPSSTTTIKGVSQDIRCDKGDRIRFRSDVLEFNQMSELLNQKSSLQGKVPSGYLNAIFGLRGDWFHDTADTKYLAFDGYFISLYYLQLITSPLILQDKVKKSVPPHWDPAALARFIQTYGTHIIVGLAVGGQDLVCVRQEPSSSISPADLRRHLEDLGDFLFSDGKSSAILHRNTRDEKVPEVFTRILQSNTMQLSSITETSTKDGLALVCSKRGGDVFLQNHSHWLQTVPAKPEAILFKFVPITSLLTGIPGSGYLSHAINLYLRYKPPPDELQYFLEFQVPRQWAPMYCELPLRHHRKKVCNPSLQFSFLGPKLFVSSTQVSCELKPVVGLRLYLEGKKSNKLALHIQHLSSLPNIMTTSSGNMSTWPCQWRGSAEYKASDQFLEPVRWKSYANICTSAVRYDPNWSLTGESNGAYIVTGVQLISKGKWPKKNLHLRLLYTHLPNFTIQKTEWAAAPETGQKSNFFTNLSTTFAFSQRLTAGQQKQAAAPAALNSGVYPDGPPVPVRSLKLLKYVETAEVVRGPHDIPGHWLVIAARLVADGGKIGLQAKFALLNY